MGQIPWPDGCKFDNSPSENWISNKHWFQLFNKNFYHVSRPGCRWALATSSQKATSHLRWKKPKPAIAHSSTKSKDAKLYLLCTLEVITEDTNCLGCWGWRRMTTQLSISHLCCIGAHTCSSAPPRPRPTQTPGLSSKDTRSTNGLACQALGQEESLFR